ncbi:MAG: 50S ribosomal protein L29 [Candidatus Marinimicrobia bacterium]|nr:50S ribosomal protein L29 [Candidatus Neomarinimicrobiota bacterium]MAQ74457.1 50S ribosomal protein L29 [Candidatus Neomarinimicrobiota bacterium]|tara:strand:- start:450 stop:665 length:216 start_codon:yes stop_codon:yes gene_type:complete
MKKRDLNNLDILDLSTMITDNEEALQNLKFQKAMQQLEDPLQIKSLKKDIAQLKTIMKEFDLGLRGNKDKK